MANNTTKKYSLIMAGGSGTRFWPESTKEKPKQYLALAGKNSLLTETLLRLEGVSSPETQFIVTIPNQEKLASECSINLINSSSGIILEPAAKNTAPCIILAIAKLWKLGAREDDVISVLPADHIILNKQGFTETINKSIELCQNLKKIVTIGIRPNFPHTGYGYIQRGDEVEGSSYQVDAFKEKPNLETATQYLKKGTYYWNAGMFVSTLGVMLKEFEQNCPEIFQLFDKLKHSSSIEEDAKIYNQAPSISIDYAVMEKSKNILVVPAQFDWNDLGSWDALEAVINPTDSNTLINNNKYYFENSKGNIISVSNKKFVSVIDIDNLVIVENDRNIMILPKESSQKVKNIVNYLDIT